MDFSFDPTDGANVKYSYTPELRGPGQSTMFQQILFQLLERVEKFNRKNTATIVSTEVFRETEDQLCCGLVRKWEM